MPAIALIRRLLLLAGIVLAAPPAELLAQGRSEGPSQLVITYRDGRRVNIPLSEIERFEVASERRAETSASTSTSASATPTGTGGAAPTASLALTGLAASVPGTWMHRSTAVFDIQRFLPNGVVTTRTGTRGSWSIDGSELVVKWPTGVVHRYRIEAGETQLSGMATPVEKKEKPEPISLERMRG
jgi:hypothetical protein